MYAARLMSKPALVVVLVQCIPSGCDVHTVSYTHLDVYKRQVQPRGARNVQLPFPTRSTAEIGAVERGLWATNHHAPRSLAQPLSSGNMSSRHSVPLGLISPAATLSLIHI